MKTDNTAVINDIRRILLDSDDFIIAAHVNPDSDAIGSCLALGLALKKLGKHVSVILEPFHEKNMIIPGQELITSAALTASVFIALDCASAERVSDPFSVMKRAPVTICIDHHLSHITFALYVYLDPEASSTAEMIYTIISPIVDMDTDIASAIYAGLLTDTGGFRHSCTSSETMMAASKLLQYNIPYTDIYNKLLKQHSITETGVLRAALNNLKLLENGCIAISFISSEEMNEIGAKATDTDGISEYLLNTGGVEVSVFLYERIKGEVKVSMRSSLLNVSETARFFGGGGHKHAAGCTIKASLAEAYNAISCAVCNAITKV